VRRIRREREEVLRQAAETIAASEELLCELNASR